MRTSAGCLPAGVAQLTRAPCACFGEQEQARAELAGAKARMEELGAARQAAERAVSWIAEEHALGTTLVMPKVILEPGRAWVLCRTIAWCCAGP